MTHRKTFFCLSVLLPALTGAGRADMVETRNGARLVGTVTKIDDGTVHLATNYAGDLKIKQKEVVSLATDNPAFVRLDSGKTLQGRMESMADEGLAIQGAGKRILTRFDEVAAFWPVDGEDPEIVARREADERRPRWAYQAGVDITGTSGNTESRGQANSLTATYESPRFRLKLYTSYNHAESNGIESADELKGGADYENYFYQRLGWYARGEAERDGVEQLGLRATADSGLTYRLIKSRRQELATRLGLGYRLERYSMMGPDNEGVVLSTGLKHIYSFGRVASLVSDLQYLPSVENFSDYRMVQDSALEIPLSAGFWKLRVGFNNQYNSRPVAGREELDTTYYARLLLHWNWQWLLGNGK